MQETKQSKSEKRREEKKSKIDIITQIEKRMVQKQKPKKACLKLWIKMIGIRATKTIGEDEAYKMENRTFLLFF